MSNYEITRVAAAVIGGAAGMVIIALGTGLWFGLVVKTVLWVIN